MRFSKNEKRLEKSKTFQRLENKLFISAIILLVVLVGCTFTPIEKGELKRFESDQALLDAFEEAQSTNRYGGGIMETFSALSGAKVMATQTLSAPTADSSAGRDFSETNVQVEGVDEADIIKTDGDYIYTITNSKLIIAKAFPVDEAEILSTTGLDDFYPSELFIHEDRLLVFGSTRQKFEERLGDQMEIMPYPRYMNLMSVKLFDISDKEIPEQLKTVDFEGSYLTSRKIGENVYFVVNSYPSYRAEPYKCGEIIPTYREDSEEFEPIAKCVEIGYIEPVQAENFITIASMSMEDEDKEVTKETIVGSGQNVYASLDNMYIAQTTWPRYTDVGDLMEGYTEKTVVTKFELDDGEIEFKGNGEVKGHILNQFSMDEFDNHFRIATTSGQIWDRDKMSANNVYVLDENLDVVGELEDLAPGEKIYSVRFMGKRGYVVTFKKVDPLFVIDLEDPTDPNVLGKLKIPGYSDYLHPYDETHIIGIGKDTIEALEDQKQGRNLNFAWYQGVKMAIFDVSDVENPIEMHKELIGDRGTDSPALHNHKAFLFDREKNLLILPITLAEIEGEPMDDRGYPKYGEYTFQGAYVYDLTLEDGFDLRGRVTHYDDDEVFKKSGYYFRGDRSVQRSLFIEDVLYTLSNQRLQLNDLDSLDRLKVLDFGFEEEPDRWVVY